MIPYIGDISEQDALVLQELAYEATSILEFGSGASTQVLAAYSMCPMRSIETEPTWIAKTQEHLRELGLREITFSSYEEFKANPGEGYDLIFDDGVLGFRREFALLAWPLLKVGGKLCFHDTRCSSEIQNMAVLLEQHSPSIRSIHINKDESNITVFEKRSAIFYENWNETEGKELWQYGKA